MHPEVRQDHPRDCPKCGMALEPATAPAPSLGIPTKSALAGRRFEPPTSTPNTPNSRKSKQSQIQISPSSGRQIALDMPA
jgi:hypothetical protein